MHDDVFDATMSVFLNAPVNDHVAPAPALPDFPYLHPPASIDLPAFIPR